jgi:hypothetical protein
MLSGRKDRKELLETLRTKKNNSVYVQCACWNDEPVSFLLAPVMPSMEMRMRIIIIYIIYAILWVGLIKTIPFLWA